MPALICAASPAISTHYVATARRFVGSFFLLYNARSQFPRQSLSRGLRNRSSVSALPSWQAARRFPRQFLSEVRAVIRRIPLCRVGKFARRFPRQFLSEVRADIRRISLCRLGKLSADSCGRFSPGILSRSHSARRLDKLSADSCGSFFLYYIAESVRCSGASSSGRPRFLHSHA